MFVKLATCRSVELRSQRTSAIPALKRDNGACGLDLAGPACYSSQPRAGTYKVAGRNTRVRLAYKPMTMGVATLMIQPVSAFARRHLSLLAAIAFLWPLSSLPLAAQGGGPSAVGVTEARELEIRRTVELTGTVEARTSSVVASEVAGLVIELGAREGDAVSRGALLARLRQENLDIQLRAARADLKEAEARLRLAQRNLTRTTELFDSGIVARQDLDDATSERTALQGRVERLNADIARVEDDIARSAVKAPFAGVVVREMTQVGEWLPVGGPVAELVSLDDLEVVLEVPERYFDQLAVGAVTKAGFEAIPGYSVTGRIRAVIPRADPQARTFPVKVAIPNRERRVGAGMLARVSFPVGESFTAVAVPKDAVVRRGQQSTVYRLGDGGAVEAVTVETGAAAGAWVEVRSGVAAGDVVITRGNERLFPGQQVTGTPVEYELP